MSTIEGNKDRFSTERLRKLANVSQSSLMIEALSFLTNRFERTRFLEAWDKCKDDWQRIELVQAFCRIDFHRNDDEHSSDAIRIDELVEMEHDSEMPTSPGTPEAMSVKKPIALGPKLDTDISEEVQSDLERVAKEIESLSIPPPPEPVFTVVAGNLPPASHPPPPRQSVRPDPRVEPTDVEEEVPFALSVGPVRSPSIIPPRSKFPPSMPPIPKPTPLPKVIDPGEASAKETEVVDVNNMELSEMLAKYVQS